MILMQKMVSLENKYSQFSAKKCKKNPIKIDNILLFPLFWRIILFYFKIPGNIDVVKAIAPLFDNPNLPDNNGWTTMHRAASRGRLEVVKFLTTLVEDSNFPDKEGHSPLGKNPFLYKKEL